MLRRMYEWVIKWAETPFGDWALFIIAFSESSFFPIPPDVLLIALGIAIPKKSFRYALLCSIGSVLGGCFGYLIGWQFMAGIGDNIINLYGFGDKYSYIQDLFMKYDAWAIGIAGFTPIPYKIFTIAAGAFKIDFTIFFIASAISRSTRFFAVGGLIYYFGPKIKGFIDKYFDMLAVAFTILLVAGFITIKYCF